MTNNRIRAIISSFPSLMACIGIICFFACTMILRFVVEFCGRTKTDFPYFFLFDFTFDCQQLDDVCNQIGTCCLFAFRSYGRVGGGETWSWETEKEDYRWSFGRWFVSDSVKWIVWTSGIDITKTKQKIKPQTLTRRCTNTTYCFNCTKTHIFNIITIYFI